MKTVFKKHWKDMATQERRRFVSAFNRQEHGEVQIDHRHEADLLVLERLSPFRLSTVLLDGAVYLLVQPEINGPPPRSQKEAEQRSYHARPVIMPLDIECLIYEVPQESR